MNYIYKLGMMNRTNQPATYRKLVSVTFLKAYISVSSNIHHTQATSLPTTAREWAPSEVISGKGEPSPHQRTAIATYCRILEAQV